MKPLLRVSLVGAGILAGLGLLASRPASAQATISVEAGLRNHYRPNRWVPVRVTLTNQGAPARVEVRARFFVMGRGPQEYRIPERDLPSGANEVHTLYMWSPQGYGGRPITVELFRDGRLVNTVRPDLTPIADENWLVYGVGPAENTAPLNLLTTASLRPRTMVQISAAVSGNRRAQTAVAVGLPAEMPDRGEGLEAADAVVLAGASERDFRPEQLTAIRDYVVAGGTAVVTGGLNWNRLDTAFYRDLLPVRVMGSGTSTSLPGSAFGAPVNPFPVCLAAPKPGAEIVLGTPERPVVVSGRRGAGRVVFTAFDPALAPFREWSGTREVWSGILQVPKPSSLVAAVTRADGEWDPYSGMSPPGYYGNRGARLSDAPYAIPQLDIPAFYVVALFLLAYVVILVPVNYFFLKARDKKEYAWITTPVIVLLFSVGAYLIGYGFKGGSTLAVKVGLVEANAGERSGAFVSYTGVFSPRKTGYDIRFADARRDPFADALFSEPGNTRSQAGLRLAFGDEEAQVEDFAIDMWAMRVLKAEGVAELGQGVESRFVSRGGGIEGSIRNGTPYALDDCVLIAGSELIPLGSLAPGGTAQVSRPASNPGAAQAALPQALADRFKGTDQKSRLRRAVCEASLLQGRSVAQAPEAAVRLVGWLRDPVGRLLIDGRSPREVAETLLVVNLR